MNEFPDSTSAKRPIYQVWIDAVTKPNIANYESIANEPDASVGTAALWLFAALAVGGIIGGLISLLFGSSLSSQLGPLLQSLPPESQETLQPLLGSAGGAGGSFLGVICGAPVGAVFGLLGYFIGVGIQSWLATLFGGTGSFGKFFYVNAAYQAPITLVTSIVGNIPLVGCLGIFIGLYSLYLNFISLQAVHKLTSGKAVIVILIPIFVACLLSICMTVFFVAVLGPAVGDVFNSINSTLTP
jgi:hypothetical protein